MKAERSRKTQKLYNPKAKLDGSQIEIDRTGGRKPSAKPSKERPRPKKK